MEKRKPQNQEENFERLQQISVGGKADQQQQQQQQQEKRTTGINEENSYIMFQRLFKRFKKNPPSTSPQKSQDDDKDLVKKQQQQQQQQQQKRDTLSTGEAENNKQHDSDDDDDGSVYSNYDYVEDDTHPRTYHSSNNNSNSNSNKDVEYKSDSGVSKSDDDSISSGSSSSYSDYDDYQFLTAVSLAASLRASSTTSAAGIKPPPPAEITTTGAAADAAATSGQASTTAAATVSPSPVAKATTSKKNPKTDATTEQLEELARTHFPDFFSDSEHGVPGAILSDGGESSDDEDAAAIQRKTEKYRTKEDEDVAVFMNLAKRMSLKSLLHLLKGHVQSQTDQYSAEYMKKYNTLLSKYNTSSSSLNSSVSSILSTAEGSTDEVEQEEKKDQAESPEKKKEDAIEPRSDEKHQHHRHHEQKKAPLVKKKLFRWAEITNEKVRTVVHEIESIKDQEELWWQPQEMHEIRSDLIETVKFYRKRRPGYIQSVEIVAKHAGEIAQQTTSGGKEANDIHSQQLQILETHMKSLMSAEHSYARGLETHIVKMLSEHRKSTVAAILDEQNECMECKDDYETTTHCLREQSLAYSNMSSKFAYAMARCDQIDALKASMSSWT
jgi:hypothetical protein